MPAADDHARVIETHSDCISVLEAVREGSGRAVGAAVRSMNASERARHAHPEALIGSEAAEVWPDIVCSGVLTDCLRVFDGIAGDISGDAEYTEGDSMLPLGFDYRVTSIGKDRVAFVVRTTTDQLRTTFLLRERQNRSRAVLSALEEGLVVQTAEGSILECNQSAIAILGLAAGVLRPGSAHDPWRGSLDAEGTPLEDDDLPTKRCVTSGTAVQNETLAVERRDGRRVWLSLNVHPLLLTGALTPYATVTSFRDITARRAAEHDLLRQALYDSLTGAANRFLLLDRLGLLLGDASRVGEQEAPGVILIDLDRFKAVNDTYGHAAGDHVLVAAVRRLQAIVRTTDTVARLGGDEFIVLVDRSTPDDLHRLADRITAALSEPLDWNGGREAAGTAEGGGAEDSTAGGGAAEDCTAGGGTAEGGTSGGCTKPGGTVTLRVSASVGFVRIDDRHRSPAEVLALADAAMYEHKARAAR